MLLPASPQAVGALVTPGRRLLRFAVAVYCCLLSHFARAEIQFDVFLGLDDRVREGHWFPVAFEILNDGPPVNGSVVLGPDGGLESQRRAFAVELPTGTRKRIVVPVFSAAGRYTRWEAQLLDPAGKLIAERGGLQPKDVAPHVPILGALPRTFGGLPMFPEVRNRAPEFVPAVSRLQSDYLPSNPIALEALTAWYLNSEKAAELKAEQVDALLSWVHSGGHLIVGIEQAVDVTSLPWLRSLLPFAPEGITNRSVEGGFERWIVSGQPALQSPSTPRRNPASQNPRRATRPAPARVPPSPDAIPEDPFTRIEPQEHFNRAEIPVVAGRRLDGTNVLALGDVPLIVSASRGRGLVTALAFSPEREPFRSWKNRSWFWARLVAVPTELLRENDNPRWGGTSIDGMFGAMLDSRQVRKLPIPALLLLLVVYLVVIGPFDQWILKRTGRQMWTWITFPVYVALFSGLIYFIGYRLRAGELEWNEMQVVDQLPRGDGAALRGRTWVSIYSPANARYRIASDQPFATFRSEFQQGGPGRGESGRTVQRLPARGFDAEAFVPVWVNQLYASDWLDAAPVLLDARLTPGADGPTLTLENLSPLRFEALKIAYGGFLHDLNGLPPGGKLKSKLDPGTGTPLDGLVGTLPMTIATIQQRRFAFGAEGSGQLQRNLDPVIVASFSERWATTSPDQNQHLLAPAGFDVNHITARGEAVVFGWAPNQAVAAPIHRFTPNRIRRDTIVRLAVSPSAKP